MVYYGIKYFIPYGYIKITEKPVSQNLTGFLVLIRTNIGHQINFKNLDLKHINTSQFAAILSDHN